MMPDEFYMARALKLARRGLYTTDPNPRVGCVLVRGGAIVGEGWHRRAGEGHAEVLALKAAAEAARGATAYVTLEPCSHHGRTPPCADALIAAGVSRVVVAMEDPNPLVAGRGLARMRQAGIEVRTAVLSEEALALNPGFDKRMRSGRPWVRVKLASSLDGRTAMASGESVWISGEAARRDVQRLRARSSCILSGSGTVLNDDPSLNVRLSATELGIEGAVRQPVRVLLDSLLRVPSDARLFQLEGEVLIYTGKNKNNKNKYLNNNIQVNYNFSDGAGIDLLKLLDDLAKREFNEVLVEAGPTLCGSLLSRKLVDEIILYQAPHIMGDTGKPLFHLPDIQQMCERIPLKLKELRRIGDDVRLTLSPQYQ